jgi:hypothetical protein
MSFKELSKNTAEAYKKVDASTKAWLDELSKNLYLYNRDQQNALWRFIKRKREAAHELEEENTNAEEETEKKEEKAAARCESASAALKPSGNRASPSITEERLSTTANVAALIGQR